MPETSDLAAVRSVAKDVMPDGTELLEWYSGYSDVHATRIAHDLGMVVRSLPPGGLVVDVAAVPLLLIGALHRRGVHVEGVDLAPDRFGTAIGRLGIRVHTCDIEREPLPYADGSVDVVVFNEIFEHLRIDPIHTLGEIRRCLAPGGLLLLSTPNGLSLLHLVRILRERKIGPAIHAEYEKLRRLGHMGHVREYPMREVADFLCAMGFGIRDVVWRGSYESRSLDGVCRLLPALRPYFSIVASRGAAP